MFGKASYKYETIGKISKDIFAGGDKPDDNACVCNDEYKYPVYSNGQGEDGLLCYSKTYQVSEAALTISARGTIGFTCIRKPYFTPVIRLITLIPNSDIDLKYLQYCVDHMQLSKSGSGAGQLTVPEFSKYEIPILPIALQHSFAAYAKECDKLKSEAQDRISTLKQTREDVVSRYFR